MTVAFERVAELQQLTSALVGGPPAAAAAAAVPATVAGQGATFASALAGAQTSPVAGASGATVPFGAEIDAAAARHGIDPALLRALVRQESGFDPAARSPAGATGLTQLMPGTAAELGVDPTDPVQALEGGARYLKMQLDRFGGDERLGLAAYNAGPGAVTRFGGVPPYAETQRYVEKVLGYAAADRAAGPSVAAGPAPPPSSPSIAPVGGALPYSTT